MSVQIRDFTEKDVPILVSLLNETYKGTYEFVSYDLETLNSEIVERKLKVLMAEIKGEVLGSVAYQDSPWGELIEWLALFETPNQKSIGNALVREIEKFVKGQTVFTVVDAESPKIDEWVEWGYKPEGGLYHMVAGLDGLKLLPRVQEGILIRGLKPEEERELVEVVNLGFGRERIKMGAIQRWKSECPPFSEEWVQIAELNGKIVSVVVARPDMIYNKFFGGKRGYLGPASTLSEHRSKHLASALTRRAMNFLYEKGMNSVALHTTEQNVPSVTLLRNLGFEIGHHRKFMRKNLSNSVSKTILRGSEIRC